MSDERPTGPHPDPWAVVEHHARAAASRAVDLTAGQRLAMYAAAAPELIGARRATRSEFGPLGGGLPGADWWTAAMPDSNDRLAWNERGDVVVSSRLHAVIRQLVVGAFGTLLAVPLFARVAGPRAIIPALIVGLGAAFAASRLAPRWTVLGDGLDHARARRTMEEFLQAYERDVPGSRET